MTNEAREHEVWKTYPDYDFIEVSNLGRVRTKDRYVPNGRGKRLVKGHVLKQRILSCGYMYVQFGTNGKHIDLSVHRMVAICFLPNPNNYPEINHIDNNPTNNVVSNLEWCTSEYNIAYREKYGTACNSPVFAINQETSEVFWFRSHHEAARQLGVNQGLVTQVVKGKRHKTGGHWFCYADKNAVEKTRIKFGNEVAEKVEKLIDDTRIV